MKISNSEAFKTNFWSSFWSSLSVAIIVTFTIPLVLRSPLYDNLFQSEDKVIVSGYLFHRIQKKPVTNPNGNIFLIGHNSISTNPINGEGYFQLSTTINDTVDHLKAYIDLQGFKDTTVIIYRSLSDTKKFFVEEIFLTPQL